MKSSLLALLFFCAFVASAAEPSLRIQLISSSSAVTLTPGGASEGLINEHPWWIKDEKQKPRYLWITGPVVKDRLWRPFEFSFTASQDSVVTLELMWGNAGQGNPEQFGAYRKLQGKNVHLKNGDFKSGITSWDVKKSQLSKEGFLVVSYSSPGKQRIYAKAGVTVTVRGEYRAASADEITPEEPPKPTTVKQGENSLTFDARNGTLLRYERKGETILLNPAGSPTLRILLEDNETLDNNNLTLRKYTWDKKEKLTLELANSNWAFTEKIEFTPRGIVRSGMLENLGKEPRKFYATDFLAYLPKSGGYFFPSTFFGDTTDNRDINRWPGPPEPTAPLPKGRLAEIPAGKELSGYFRTWPLLLTPAPGRTLLAIADFRRDEGRLSLLGGADAVLLRTRFDSQGWVESGTPQKIDGAYLEVFDSAFEPVFKNEIFRWYRDMGLTPPADRPESVWNARIYEMYPGGEGRQNDCDLGGFRDTEKRLLPRIAALGFNTIWQMPTQSFFGVKYFPADYFKNDPRLGTTEEQKSLNAAARRLGINLWMDIVPHGGSPDDSGMLRGNSPFDCIINEDGNFINNQAFDYNAPSWQAYMKQVAEHYVNTLGSAGLRIDYAIGSYKPNWRRKNFPAPDSLPGNANPWNRKLIYRKINEKYWRDGVAAAGGEVPPIPYERASNTLREGGTKMIEAIRAGARSRSNEVVVLAEGGGPTLISAADLIHDRQFSHIVPKLLRFTPEVFTARLAEWLEGQYYAEPEGTLLMRIVDCHDTATPPIGVSALKAYIATAYFIHGVPLGAEYPGDIGYGIHFMALNRLRATLPELRHGKPDYTAIKNRNPAVFTVLRKLDNAESVTLVNFSGVPVTSAFRHAASGVPFESLWGKTLRKNGDEIEVDLEPFGCAVVTYRKEKQPPVAPPEKLRADTRKRDSLQLRENGDFLIVGNSDYTLTVDRKNGLLYSFQSNDAKIGKADLALPRTHELQAKVISVESAGTVVITADASGVFRLEYRCTPEALTLNFTPERERIGLLLPFPGAERWFVNTAEGKLEDISWNCGDIAFNRNRSSTRLPYNSAILWSSSRNVLDMTSPLIGFGFANGAKLNLELPPSDALTLLAAGWNGNSSTHAALFGNPGNTYTLKIDCNPSRKIESNQKLDLGGLTLRNESFDWVVENRFYKVRLRNSGTIRSVVVGGRVVLEDQDFFSRDRIVKGTDFMLSMDPETTPKLRWEDKTLRIGFQGQLVKRHPGSKNPENPIYIDVEYVFDNTPSFRTAWRIQVASPLPKTPALFYQAKCVPEALGLPSNSIALFDKTPAIGSWQSGELVLTPTGQKPSQIAPAIFGEHPKPDYDLSFERRMTFYSALTGKALFFVLPEEIPGFYWSNENTNAQPVFGNAADGNVSLRLQNLGAKYRQIMEKTIEPGNYRLSLKVRAENFRPEPRRGGSSPMTLKATWIGEDGSRQESKLASSESQGTYNWREFGTNFTVTRPGYFPQLVFTAPNDGTGDIYIDDLKLEKQK
ncbi:MAG: hypothetical protein LBM70_09965 [Victivallales bacterium]|jgi:hypothetical protein|nr:hypothetical protein [Victivallales bacterium]